MNIESMTMQEVEARLAEISTEITADGADFDALDKEVDQLFERRAAITAAAAKERELRAKVAQGMGTVMASTNMTAPEERKQEETKMDENIIELIDDESGETVQFLHLATLMHEGKEYIAVTDAAEDDEECGVFFMEIITEGEDDSYSPVEDEKLQDVLFQQFVALMDEEDDE